MTIAFSVGPPALSGGSWSNGFCRARIRSRTWSATSPWTTISSTAGFFADLEMDAPVAKRDERLCASLVLHWLARTHDVPL